MARDLAQLLRELDGAAPEPDCEAFLSDHQRMILDNWEELRSALERLALFEEALQKIRDREGKVCEEFATCDHPACASSYHAWATAAAALIVPAEATPEEVRRRGYRYGPGERIPGDAADTAREWN